MIGKGGVGKTTIAAATAAAAAAAGRSVLLVSLDRAHSLADVFGRPAEFRGSGPWTLPGGLAVSEPDVLALITERLAPLTALLSGLGGAQRPEMIDPQELTVVPGLEELVGLSSVIDKAQDGRWDLVVVDCPPTAEALRAIDLPAALTAYLERLWPRHRRLTQGTGSAAGMIAVGVVEKLAAEAERVRAVLADPGRTGAMLVTNPEPVAVAEARRTVTATALLAMPLIAIVLNRVLVDAAGPGAAASEAQARVADDPIHHWYRTRMAEQQAVLAALRADCPQIPIMPVPFAAQAPIGAEALAGLGADAGLDRRIGRDLPHPAGPAAPVHESGTGLDAVYRWDLSLPLVDPQSVDLGRVDDDLIVSAAGVRRRLRLPSVLRRCTVTGARLDGGVLSVRFAPDPAVWPL